MKKNDVIKEYTSVYIKNGGWTQHIKKDAITGEKISIIMTEKGIRIYKINENSTYNDLPCLGENDDLSIYYTNKSGELNESNLNEDQFATVVKDSFYISENKLFIAKNTESKFTLNPKDIYKAKFDLFNVITEKNESLIIKNLSYMYSKEFCLDLYNIYSSKTTDEYTYIKGLVQGNKTMKKLLDVGRLLKTLISNDNTSWLKLVKEEISNNTHSKDDQLNLPGDYSVDGSDIQYFFKLDDNTKVLIIEKAEKTFDRFQSILTPVNYTEIPYNKLKPLLLKSWNDIASQTYNDKLLQLSSLIEILHSIAYYSLYENKEKIAEPVWDVSRYYYWD